MIVPPPGAASSSTADSGHQTPRLDASNLEQIFGIEDETQFLAGLVRYVLSVVGGQAGALFALNPNSRDLEIRVSVLAQGIPSTLLTHAHLRQATSEALRQNQAFSIPVEGDFKGLYLAAPCSSPQGEILVFGVLLYPESSEALAHKVLQMAAPLLAGRRAQREDSQLASAFTRATALLEVFHRAGQTPEFGKALATMGTELRTLIGCDQAGIGLGDEKRCKVVALSSSSNLDARGQTSTLLSRGMREAIGVGRCTVWPIPDALPDAVLTAGNLDRLLEATGMRQVLTFPLISESGTSVGALACLWKEPQPAVAQNFTFIQAATPHLASVLSLLDAAKPRGLRAAWRAIWPKKGVLKRIGVVALPILFTGVMLLPVPHRITANCELQPKTKRQVAAPFNGILETPHVKPGEIVTQGQLLATLDGKEIALELAETTFKHQATLKLRDQAMANDDVSGTVMENLNAEALALEIDLLRHRQENLNVRAPIDGLILSGNLEQSEGVPVSEGQQLFEIAPIEELIVEVAVSDADISFVEAGMDVSVRLESQLKYQFSAPLEVVHPISEIQNDKNVFVCQTTIPNENGDLRPGMGGKARIKAGRQRLGWILFHKPWNFIRMRFW